MDLSSFTDVGVTASGGMTSNPEGGLCAKSLWIFRESSNGDGPPDLRGRFGQRRLEASLNDHNSFPHPSYPKEKPAGLKRRAQSLYRRRERGPKPRAVALSGLELIFALNSSSGSRLRRVFPIHDHSLCRWLRLQLVEAELKPPFGPRRSIAVPEVVHRVAPRWCALSPWLG